MSDRDGMSDLDDMESRLEDLEARGVMTDHQAHIIGRAIGAELAKKLKQILSDVSRRGSAAAGLRMLTEAHGKAVGEAESFNPPTGVRS
ncbi:MAG: hypothetical protein O7A04_03425 [Acidobacteria bacterium]|nr:hypothetical protein [Acidobacteriota bacterium]